MVELKENEELNEFLSKLETRNPTNNMMLWMKYFNKICDKICCHSTDCGSIRCSGCLIYLTGMPPSSRFQCIECEILPPETIFNPRPEICEKCFIDPSISHNHAKWLKVDNYGNHSIILRSVGISESKELKISDFPIVNANPSKVCEVCTEEFNTDNPAVSYPGCEKLHGSPINDKLEGLIDSLNFSHAECLMSWYQATNRTTYCGDLSYCDLCRFQKEKSGWENQFIYVKNKILDNYQNKENLLNSIREKLSISIEVNELLEKDIFYLISEKLINLHPQEWLRNIIKNIFDKK